MKFVAAKDFANVKSINLVIEGAVHPRHVHKGARFEIPGEKFEFMAPLDEARAKSLISRGCAVVDKGDEASAKIIAKIDQQAAEEKAQRERLKAKQDAHVTIGDQISRLTAALEKLAVKA